MLRDASGMRENHIRIGYACIKLGPPETGIKGTIKKNATPDKLLTLIGHNLHALADMLAYNARNNIRLFRISSDIIPFGSSPVNNLPWQQLFRTELQTLGAFAIKNGIRLSMHPGQYTVLNSPDAGVVERAVTDLAYHASFLDALGMGPENKIILHIGGLYGDRAAAVRRFTEQYQALPANIKARLVIENDDKMYTIDDALAIGTKYKIPVVFDNLHHAINHLPDCQTELDYIDACGVTWGTDEGPPKLHYSQQQPGKRPGSHSTAIAIRPFMEFYQRLGARPRDVMLEVKDKNLSAIKCILCTTSQPHIKYLEQEWARYKYSVLEHDPAAYQKIRALLKDKSDYPAQAFYELLESALALPVTPGNFQNAAQHVWGYFVDKATEREKTGFLRLMAQFSAGEATAARVKGALQRLVLKYPDPYLLDSYYFLNRAA